MSRPLPHTRTNCLPACWLWIIVVICYGCIGQQHDKKEGDKVHLWVNRQHTEAGDWEVIAAPMFWWLDIYGKEDLFRKDAGKFTDDQVMLFCAHQYLDEVVKDGHQSFLERTTGLVQDQVDKGLLALGLQKERQIFQQARQRYSRSKDHPDDLSDEDSAIIQLAEGRDFSPVFRQYIIVHQDAFLYDQWMAKPQ